MWAVKLHSNKILQFLKWACHNGHKMDFVLVLVLGQATGCDSLIFSTIQKPK